MSSFKISSMGETIGTMQQDRATAIAGTLGKGPALVPMTVTLQSTREDGSAAKRSVQRIRSPTTSSSRRCSPTSRSSTRSARTSGSSARRRSPSRAARRIKGHGDLTLEDVFAGDNAMLGAATAVAGPIDDAARQRPRAGDGRRRSTSRSRRARRRARVDHRARLARRRPSARRPHRAAQGADPQLPRRGKDFDRADRDSGERLRVAVASSSPTAVS